MIALVLSPAWAQYYSSSPYLNLINSLQHDRFKKFILYAHEIPNHQIEIAECEAVVFDDVSSHMFDFFKGPKFMVGGDEHSHSPAKVQALEEQYDRADYILSGSPRSPLVSPPYFYVSEKHRAKRVYLPHSVPDVRRVQPRNWLSRVPKAVISGSTGKEVYPFRHEATRLAKLGKHISELPLGMFSHENYFAEIGNFQAAITCNSILTYTVAKYFEIPWMNTVLMAPPIPEWEQKLLGFENGYNMVFTEHVSDIPGLVQFMQTEMGMVTYDQVARQGRELMEEHHTVSKRLDYIAVLVDKAIYGGFTPDIEYDIFKEVTFGN